MLSRAFALLALVLVPAVASAKKIRVPEVTSHNCAQHPTLTINDSNGSFKVTGACETIAINGGHVTLQIESVRTLTVNGANNTVSIDQAETITTNGSDNTITYKKTINGGAAKISTRGDRVTVTQTK